MELGSMKSGLVARGGVRTTSNSLRGRQPTASSSSDSWYANPWSPRFFKGPMVARTGVFKLSTRAVPGSRTNQRCSSTWIIQQRGERGSRRSAATANALVPPRRRWQRIHRLGPGTALSRPPRHSAPRDSGAVMLVRHPPRVRVGVEGRRPCGERPFGVLARIRDLCPCEDLSTARRRSLSDVGSPIA